MYFAIPLAGPHQPIRLLPDNYNWWMMCWLPVYQIPRSHLIAPRITIWACVEVRLRIFCANPAANYQLQFTVNSTGRYFGFYVLLCSMLLCFFFFHILRTVYHLRNTLAKWILHICTINAKWKGIVIK